MRSGETDLGLISDFDLGDDFETERLADLQPYALLSAGHPLKAYVKVKGRWMYF